MSQQAPVMSQSWLRRVWSWLLGRRALDHDAVCGKCSYLVTDLPTFTCPECGSDLRQVGIVRRARPPKRKLRWADLPGPIRRKYRWRLTLASILAVLLTASSVFLLSWSRQR